MLGLLIGLCLFGTGFLSIAYAIFEEPAKLAFAVAFLLGDLVLVVSSAGVRLGRKWGYMGLLASGMIGLAGLPLLVHSALVSRVAVALGLLALIIFSAFRLRSIRG